MCAGISPFEGQVHEVTVDSCSGLPGRIAPPKKNPAHQTTEAPWEGRGLQQGVEVLRAGGDPGVPDSPPKQQGDVWEFDTEKGLRSGDRQ